MNKKGIKSDLMLLSVAFIWGTTFIIVQNAVAILPPHSFNAVRFLAAAIFLFIIALVFDRKNLFKIPKKAMLGGILLGVFLFFGYATQTIGLLYTTAANAGFITGLSVVLVPILSLFILKARPRFTSVIGVGLAASGLYLMTMISSDGFNIGDALVLVGAVFFALQIVGMDKYAPLYSPYILALIQIFVVGILSLIAALLFEDTTILLSPEIMFSYDVILALVITSLFATALAFLIQATFQRYSSPTKTAIIFAMEPVFAALTSMIVLWQWLTWNVALGGSLIFLGMILAEIPPDALTRAFTRKKAPKESVKKKENDK